ncbi:MAG: hypothetical protein U1D97_06660 [Desulfuromonadales bacterium]|nr:hypothetical protein [Desulfuromonadales bacterium]
MSKTIAFTVPVTPAGQSAPVKARLEQSLTLGGARTLVAEANLVEDLGLLAPPQELFWEVDIDGSQYYWLSLLSAINEPSPPIVIGPAAAVGKVTVEVWTRDAIGQIKEGCKVRVVPVLLPTAAGGDAIVVEGSDETDVNGYVAVDLYADSGVYKIVVASKVKNIDTAGKAGQVLNWIDLS